jgi:hypothetical protein
MLEILKFIFSSFWIWLGSFLILVIIVYGIADIIKSFRVKNVTNVFNGSTKEDKIDG